MATQLKAEVSALAVQAEDQASVVDGGMDIPAEIARREALVDAKRIIEARAQERFEQEQADYLQKEAKRQTQRDAGKKPRGKPPQPGPRDTDQVNLTDDESRIMPSPAAALSSVITLRSGWMPRRC